MSDNGLSTADKVAMYGGTGLVLLGTVFIGIVEMLFGATHPVTGEGQIVHEALIPVDIRSYIILLGFLIWGGYAVYKVAVGGRGLGTTEDRAVGAGQAE